MSSFAMVMLEEGVEVELPTDLTEVIEILDKEVPYFSCDGHCYTVTSGKAVLGKSWELMVKSAKGANQDFPTSLGRLELETIDSHNVRLRIPPRDEQEVPDAVDYDPDGRLFCSFMYHTLNALQRYKLIELPGVIPVA